MKNNNFMKEVVVVGCISARESESYKKINYHRAHLLSIYFVFVLHNELQYYTQVRIRYTKT
jgi:hypothetical protein